MPYPEGLPLYTIWDDITHFLDSTKDLLSLALTCHTFKELIIPDHLEYRYICCDLRRSNVWEFLSSRPRLARGIRFVKLEYEPSDSIRLPQASLNSIPISDPTVRFDDVPTDEHRAHFKDALSRMTHLKKFVWEQEYNSVEQLVEISEVLTNTTNCLEALAVQLWCPSADDQPVLDKLSIWNLTGLKQVIVDQPGPAAIEMILYHCPNIEDLSLSDLSNVTISYLMQCAEWKRLRRLHLWSELNHQEDLLISQTEESFFDRHSNIQHLYLCRLVGRDPTHKLPASYLPKLRSLGSGTHLNTSVRPSVFTSEALSRLVHWEYPIHNIDVNTFPQMNRLESVYLSIKERFWSESLLPFLFKAPNLKKICLLNDEDDFWKHVSKMINISRQNKTAPDVLLKRRAREETLIEIFVRCSSLTHIVCDFQFTRSAAQWCASFPTGLEPLSKRLSVLRYLKYFRIHTDGDQMFVKLERDEDGLYSGYQFVSTKEAGGDPEHWGNFFSDL